MPCAIETQGLTRRFGDCSAVDALDMHVPRLAIYGFLGRNGAGKTTTIKLLLGLLRPDAGEMRIDGVDPTANRIGAARRVGALLEAHGFYPNLSGRENLRIACRLLGLRAIEIDRVLDITEMTAHARRRVADFSLGMRQRLGLARAMLGAPPILILDEPTNGLDPEGIADMRGLLRELPARGGATVLLSSHFLSEIEHVATHIGILSNGRLVKEGALSALKAGIASEVEIGTTNPSLAIQIAREHGYALSERAGSLIAGFPAGQDPHQGAAALNLALCAGGVDVHSLCPRQRSLETLYLQAANAPPSPLVASRFEALP